MSTGGQENNSTVNADNAEQKEQSGAESFTLQAELPPEQDILQQNGE